MAYVTKPVCVRRYPVSWEDILYDRAGDQKPVHINTTNTITRFRKETEFDHRSLKYWTETLAAFNAKYWHLITTERSALYDTFFIPKKNSNKKRRIDAPKPELKKALYELKDLLERLVTATHHQAAYAYVPGRNCLRAIKRHQRNDSKWFLKTDFSDFFGSTNQAFLCETLAVIYPFNHITRDGEANWQLSKALSLCFLNGGLPQGTPISPLLTNLMMIPLDYQLSNKLGAKRFVYTRYADDILISAKDHFVYKTVVKLINETLQEFNAPFMIKHQKTRYGSRNGANWNLGVMLNKDNSITVGHVNKKYFKATVCRFITDHLNGNTWKSEEAAALAGTLAYYQSVEKDYFNYVLSRMNEKFGVDIYQLLKQAQKI